MGNETKKTEQLIQIYKEDPVKENLMALVHQMKKTVFFVPAALPDTPEVAKMKEELKNGGEKQVKMPAGTAPIPNILKNPEGKIFFPIYTSQTQIPKEPKYDLLMQMPFPACMMFVLNNKLDAQGMALNPFSDNLLFPKDMLAAIRREEEAKGAQQKQVTPKQYKIMMRQKAEFHDLPLRVFQEGAPFIHKVSDDKEAVINEVYQKAYERQDLYPYSEKDFAVMPLNISEELLLVRLDLPAVKEAAQLCHRIYITLNPANDDIHYFTVERGKEKGQRNLCGVDASGKHIEYGEAPVEGAEIQRVMDIISQEKMQTS